MMKMKELIGYNLSERLGSLCLDVTALWTKVQQQDRGLKPVGRPSAL